MIDVSEIDSYPPPSDESAERRILGAMLGGAVAPGELSAMEFCIRHHQWIFEKLSLMDGVQVRNRRTLLLAAAIEADIPIASHVSDIDFEPANLLVPMSEDILRVKELARRRALIEYMRRVIAALCVDHMTHEQAVRSMARRAGQ